MSAADPISLEQARRDREAAQLDAQERPVGLQDFYAYLPDHRYIFTPTRELWPASSVDARLLKVPLEARREVAPSHWLDQHRCIEQMTWAPGMPMVIDDQVIADGGWIGRHGVHCFNLYRPPLPPKGSAAEAGPWLCHVRRIYPDEAAHIVTWLAHRVQRPAEKINHALVLGGNQGIGKDSLVEPVKHAVGPWNFAEVAPTHLLGRFNGFVKSVILRVSEARDLGDVDRYSFYDHMKGYIAAPPDVIRCDEKNLREHSVMNVTGVIITSNHKSDGIYLPADDRRHFVAWSGLSKEDFGAEYWRDLWGWYTTGGIGHVAAYLAGLDLTDFDPKAPPPKTAAWHDIVDANRAPEDAEIADALESLNKSRQARGEPIPTPAITLTDIIVHTSSDEFRIWLRDRRNSRQIPHRLEAAGYVAVRNDTQADGRWKVDRKNVVIYARQSLSVRDRIAAATALCEYKYP